MTVTAKTYVRTKDWASFLAQVTAAVVAGKVPDGRAIIDFKNDNYVQGFETQVSDYSTGFEVVTATNVIDASENGKTFFLDSATEFVSTLPAPALGLHFTFIVKTAPSGASYTVVSTSSANIVKGQQQSAAGDAGDTGTADDTISFVDGQAVAGDRVDVVCDGTSWFAYAQSKVAAGITFTQAS